MVKRMVKKTRPSPAGLWHRYLEQAMPDADQFVIELCYGFLQGSAAFEEAFSEIVADDDLLWYVQEFIESEAGAIRKHEDNEPLVVGLAAVGIIAPGSDPRDVTGWIDLLFQTARAAQVKEIQMYFERVASRLQTRCPLAANEMRSYPARLHRFETRRSENAKRHT